MWVQNQRNSWHGVDFPYHSALDVDDYYRSYAETLLAVDESIGRVFEHLKRRGELDSTLIVYMGDNGFAFIVKKLNKQLFEVLGVTDGMSMPLTSDAGQVQRLRRPDKAKSAEFPPQFTIPPK